MREDNGPILTPGGTPWRTRAGHRRWLEGAADRLFALFEAGALDPAGGFLPLDADGRPMRDGAWPRGLHDVTRMIHCFSIGHLLGRPRAERIVDHGMAFLAARHRDAANGGWFWSVGADGPADATKQAYGHAFVLLAASGATLAGHPDGPALLAEAAEVLDRRFWEEAHGAVAEDFRPDWSPTEAYRGQNSNMHLTEALMAAFEATGERLFLDRAARIADLVIGRHARAEDWRVAEHFRDDWSLDRDYAGDPMFRPAGTTPGHWLEWSRLLLQLHVLSDGRHGWMAEASEALFASAIRRGWDRRHGGFFYTLDWNDRPLQPIKLWWPVAEAIGAAHFLCEHRPSAFHEGWYRHLWSFAADRLIDPASGGWRPELSEDLVPNARIFKGIPDLYHALQATLIPLYPATGSLTRVVAG